MKLSIAVIVNRNIAQPAALIKKKQINKEINNFGFVSLRQSCYVALTGLKFTV